MNYEGSLNGHRDWITSIACPQTADSPVLVVSTSRDGTAISWRRNSNQHTVKDAYALPDHRLEGHTGFVSSVSLADDTYAVTGSWDRSLRLWKLNTGVCSNKFIKHTKDVLSVCFSPDKRQIVSGGRDNVVRVFNVEGKCVSELVGHNDWVTSVAFFPTPGSSKVISGCTDGTAKIWDLETRTCLHTLVSHKNSVNSVTVSPDGSLCATGSKDGKAILWDANTGSVLFDIDCEKGINQLAFSPSRFWLSIATAENVVVYELQSRKKILELVTEMSGTKVPACTCIAWSADGNTLYSGHSDNIIRAWTVSV